MRENAYTIEAMRREDIPEVLPLEREAFGQMAWRADDFEAAIASKCDVPLVIRTTATGTAGRPVPSAEATPKHTELLSSASTITPSAATGTHSVRKPLQTGAVQDAGTGSIGLAGYAVLRIIAPEAEIENICVAPACRRTGAGNALMDEMLRLAAEQDAKRIFLEVRAHNEPAKALYRKKGFVESYRRKNYYQGPTEDAIIMMKE